MKALIRVTGAVQGVGYRPYVAELASKYQLSGEVKNCGGIVEIIAVGADENIRAFHEDLKVSGPHGSIVLDVSLQEVNEYEPEGHNAFSGFHIVESSKKDETNALPVFPPDIGICPDCLRELFDINDRRYRYPLISCTSCGPRYSILKGLPYDRENITMDIYPMCPACEKEYKMGRRRHAQTISCHDCGPQMIFKKDKTTFHKDEAVTKAVQILKDGGIVGLKGIGGYQLLCTPSDENSVARLREIKGRESKPFAIMFGDVSEVSKYCFVSETEEKYLCSDARPIVLLDRREQIIKNIANNVCENSRQIGAFLPSSGIHELLIKELGCLIVTSGNISGSPMIVSDREFSDRFEAKIDGILYYERKIERPLDDSVLSIVRFYDGTEKVRFIRRARGYVPLPVFLKKPLKDKNLYIAFGADLKNTFSIGYGDRIIPSQFFGDMDEAAVASLQKSELKEALRIFGAEDLDIECSRIICDMHPSYISTKAAESFTKDSNLKYNQKTITECAKKMEYTQDVIQHHHAHIGSVMAEYGLTSCIGVAFDGTGFGLDGTIWGSEILICDRASFERREHLKPVKIVGQDEAMKNAAVSGTCFLADAGIEDVTLLSEGEDKLIRAALSAGINSFPNSGMGRLFDAVSAILGIATYNTYEGECAISLQNAAEDYLNKCHINDTAPTTEVLDLGLGIHKSEDNFEWDSSKLIRDIVMKKADKGIDELSYMFHNTFADAVLKACASARDLKNINDVCLSGGVFANRLLLNLCYEKLCKNGFVVYLNGVLPTNDSGISVGQIYLDSLREE